MINRNVVMFDNGATSYTHKEEDILHEDQRGHKRYELTNHLGNVLAVINDRKIASGSSGTVFSNDFTSDVSGLVALPNSTLTHAGGELEVSVTSQGAGVQLSYTGTTPGKV